jgi:hypothetical protein
MEATITDVVFFVLLAWTIVLVAWTDIVDKRARNIRRLIERRAMRHPSLRPVRKPAHTLHEEIEQWLRDGAK